MNSQDWREILGGVNTEMICQPKTQDRKRREMSKTESWALLPLEFGRQRRTNIRDGKGTKTKRLQVQEAKGRSFSKKGKVHGVDSLADKKSNKMKSVNWPSDLVGK